MPSDTPFTHGELEAEREKELQIMGEFALIKARDRYNISAAQKDKIRSLWRQRAVILRKLAEADASPIPVSNPLLADSLLRLSLVCEDLSRGIVPASVELARKGGRPLKLGERHDIAKAIYFLMAVEDGHIQCQSPIQTVAVMFAVSKQAVRGWRKRADDICEGVPKPHPNMIEAAMRNAGKRYSVIGRGAT